MIVVKGIILMLIFGITTFLGFLMATRYKERVRELKDLITIMNIIETINNIIFDIDIFFAFKIVLDLLISL